MGIIAALFSGFRVPGSPNQLFADENTSQPHQALVNALLDQQVKEDVAVLEGSVTPGSLIEDAQGRPIGFWNQYGTAVYWEQVVPELSEAQVAGQAVLQAIRAATGQQSGIWRARYRNPNIREVGQIAHSIADEPERYR